MAVDPLRLGMRRARGCCQTFREMARGDLAFADLPDALRSSGGCGGKGCNQCAEAALRLVDHLGYHREGDIDPTELTEWVREYVEPLAPEFQLRAAGALAYLQRHSHTSSAIRTLASVAYLLEKVPVAERAHHFARSAFVLTEARLFEDARHAVEQSRELYEIAAPQDPERGPASAAVADTYIEISAAYVNAEPRFEHAVKIALNALVHLSEADAPMTWHTLTANTLTLLVSAWRSDVQDIDPLLILNEIESCFPFNSRRSDPAATSMRWLWLICTVQAEGLTQQARNRLRHVRSGLIAQRRWRDLLCLELDVLWSVCYHQERPSSSRLISQAGHVRRALVQNGEDLALLRPFENAVSSSTYLTREVQAPLFGLRGARQQIHDVRLR